MKTVKGKVAAITGAASGIGRAVAELLAKQGCHVALSDVDEAGLQGTAEACRRHDVQVHTRRVDVASRQEVHAWADEVARVLGAVHVVVNNAGVAMGATVEDTRYEDYEWVMNVDFWGVVYGTKAFLPHLRAAGEGHIVNVSSVFGLVAVPTQSAYNAAKFAVRGFTEALRQELEVEGSSIGVTCVHPGGIKTNITRNAKYVMRPGWVNERSGDEFERLFSTSPEKAAAVILAAILGNRRRQLIGVDAAAIDLVQRSVPGLLHTLMVAGMKRRARKMKASGG